MKLLYAVLSKWAVTPFVWGVSDCALSLADWIQLACGLDHDPAGELRGAYSNRLECYRVTGWLRDPEGAVDRIVQPIGIMRTDVAKPGDIGVILTTASNGRLAPVGAIKTATDGVWAARSEGGDSFVQSGRPLAVRAAWGVGYEG